MVVTGAASPNVWCPRTTGVALPDRQDAAEPAGAELRDQGVMALTHDLDRSDWSAVGAACERVRQSSGPWVSGARGPAPMTAPRPTF